VTAEQREAWIERQVALAPTPTLERWMAANAALGIRVKHKSS
jgi:hypothetical protein